MSAIACNFALLSVFDAKYDVTWSFQYSLCGAPSATGGFATFLFDDSTLAGGGISTGLGYGPSDVAGVSNAILGIGFDSTGLFATTGVGYSTGVANPVANSATLRTGTSFAYQGSVLLPFDVVESSETFRTLRFNLTDVGQTLRIHQYDELNKSFALIGALSTGYVFATDTPVRIGVSVATPVSGDVGCVFKIKDLHHQGKLLV